MLGMKHLTLVKVNGMKRIDVAFKDRMARVSLGSVQGTDQHVTSTKTEVSCFHLLHFFSQHFIVL